MSFLLLEMHAPKLVRVTDSNGATVAPRFHLRTFGTLSLAGPDDAAFLGKHGHHRRRLALLAVLAAAGDRGWSRDQLLLFFWPESTQSRARHSLDQLLYALKGSVAETLFASANPVRINPEVVSSDVGAFAAALERGDFAEAVNQYRGPFLDGFYLEDSPEFERWAEGERVRLKSEYSGALEGLAREAESQADHVTAVKWWRKLLEIDPVSSRNAAALIRALMNAGDHAAALQYAEQYESLVSRELDTSVGPAVASLVAEVRADAKTERIGTRKTTARPEVAPTLTPTVPTSLEIAATPSENLTDPVPLSGGLRSPGRKSRWSLRIAGAALFAVAALFAATRGDSRTATGESTILVLPFINVSGNREDAEFVDGLTEEMMAALNRVAGLSVIARSSSFALRNTTIDARRLGDSLDVASILEGSIQRSASSVRVQVRLIDALKGSTRWTNTYDRDFTDIFAMQSEIARSVAQELNLELGNTTAATRQRSLTQNYVAYELYLRGRDPVHLRTDSGSMVGLAQLQQAVALDSNFAAAYAAMPFMYVGMRSTAPTPDSNRALQRLARVAAEKSLLIDSLLPEAWTGMGVAMMGPFDALPAAQAAFRRAIALGGGATTRARELLGRNLLWSGRYAEALNEALRASREDPLSPTAAANVGEALCVNGRTDEGLVQLARLTDLTPTLRRVPAFIGLCYALKGMWNESLVEWKREYSGYDPWAAMYGYALARSGAVADTKRLQREYIATWEKTGRGATKIALIAAGLGDLDQAFEWLEKTADDGGGVAAVMYPLFAELHADPRFEKVRQQFGLPKR
jgi:TolB-like protein/DNA-binding SARP family transcriptional activator